MEIVKTLLFIYAAVLLLNALYSGFLFFLKRDRLYLYLLFLWLSTFLNATLQGFFQNSPTEMVLSFSTYFISSIVLANILGLVSRQTLPNRNYCVLMASALGGGLIAYLLDGGFTLMALPTAIGVSFPMFHSAFLTLRSRATSSDRVLLRVFSTLLILNAIHFMDYPFLRMDTRYSVFGFSIALTILLSFSIFLPSFLIKDISDRYADQLTQLNTKLVDYQKQLAELMSLAQVGEMSFSFVHDMASPTMLLMHYTNEMKLLHKEGVGDGTKLIPYSKGIEEATARLVGLQKLFRALMKKEDAHGQVEIDLNEVINKTIDLYHPFLEFHQIKVTVQLSEPSFKVVTLQGVIERILLNLIQNAVTALGDLENKKIYISLIENIETFSLVVRDTGPGIP
ncbi:MAG: hypothetical protein AABZ55_10560, partial [Bdellovibrionota bacterium]